MDTGFRERLASLADDAPARLPVDSDLWVRGRALRRRRTTLNLAVLVMVLVAVGGLAGLGVSSTSRTPVAPTSGHVGMPDTFYKPSPWLAGTDDEGPLGQLIAVEGAPRRHWWSRSSGVVGISASTGDYRFLDLPRWANETQVALAPDGSHVAYWTTGRTSADPYRGGGPPVTGLAVYDTTTGQTRQVRFPSEHGLAVDLLAWMDDATVAFRFGQWEVAHGRRAGTSTDSRALVLTLGSSGTRSFPALQRGYPDLASTDRRGQGTTDTGSVWGFGIVDVAHRGGARRYRVSQPVYGGVSLDPSGTRVAGIFAGSNVDGDTGNLHKPLLVGDLGSGIDVQLHRVPVYRFTGQIVGWLDLDHVLTVAMRKPDYVPRLESVDVTTGHARTVSVMRAGEVQPAMGLVSAPSVPGHRPPSPWDPRAKLALGILCLLGLGLGAARLWWVRRVRA